MLNIKMYPAKNGDAFLIKQNSTNPVAILIDGGYAATFKNWISNDLKLLAQLGYSLNLVVVTHIDADHIAGLLEFFRLNGNSQAPKIIPVENVWHNSLRSLSSTTDAYDNQSADDKDLLTEILRRGYPMPVGEDEVEPVEISARQGSSLAALLLGGGYCWNIGKGMQSINSEEVPTLKLSQDFLIRVIGPSVARLEELNHQWIAELRRNGFTGKIGVDNVFDDAFEFLCAYENLRTAVGIHPTTISASTDCSLEDVYLADNSVTNGSSIALIVELGISRLLFLGDSWAEDIELALRALPDTKFPIIFDVIKISHHGSLHNTSPALLKLIDSPVFLISSSGKCHDHPDLEALRAIVDRPSTFKRHLYFNYTTEASQQMHHYTSVSGAEFSIYEDSTDWIDIEMRE